jgi:bromodomain-containing factor 1
VCCMLTAEMTSVDQQQPEETVSMSAAAPVTKGQVAEPQPEDAMAVDTPVLETEPVDAQQMTEAIYGVHAAVAEALNVPESQAAATSNATATSTAATASTATTTEVSPALLKEQMKYCQRILKGLKRHRDASPFQLPVDPVALGIPDYFTIVKHPMDLSTVSRKMDLNEYASPGVFIADVEQMLNNCFTYNAPESQVAKMGRSLEKYFKSSMEKMPMSMGAAEKAERIERASAPTASQESLGSPLSLSRPKREAPRPASSSAAGGAVRRGSGSGSGGVPMSFCGQALRELLKKQHAHLNWPFAMPVDPVALGIPDYFTVIKQPMDLSTIRKKLDTGAYSRPEQFEGDIRTMFANCYAYNQPDSDVYRLGKELEAIFDAKWAQKPQAKAKEHPVPAPLASAAASSSMSSMSGGNGASSGTAGASGRSLGESRFLSASQIIPSLEAIYDDSEKILTINEYIQVLQAELGKLLVRRNGGSSTLSGMGSMSGAMGMSAGGSSSGAPARKATAPRKKSTALGSVSGAGASVSGGPSAWDELMVKPMSFDEKRELSEDVGKMPPERLVRVLEIIQECMPNLRGSSPDSEVIELDIEALDVRTLRTLQAFIWECLYPERKRKLMSTAGGSSGKKQRTGGEVVEVAVESVPLTEPVRQVPSNVNSAGAGASAGAGDRDRDHDDLSSTSEEDEAVV